MKKINVLTLLAACTLMLAACNNQSSQSGGNESGGSGGGNESSSVIDENIPVTGVSISGNGNGVAKGSAIDLMAEITPANATNKNVTWSSDDESIATVDSTGRVSGVEFGRTVIRVRTEDGGFTSTYKIAVTKEGTKVVGVQELIDDMIDTDYQINETGLDVYGLSDPTIVGARADMDSQVLFEVPGDSEFESAAVIQVENITLEQAQQFFNVATLNDTIKIRTAIRLAKQFNDANKLAKIVFPENGHLHLNGSDIESSSGSICAVIYIEGLNGTYFVGNNTLLEIDMPGAGVAGYFFIKNCQNLYMNGLKLTQDTPTSLTGSIKSYDLNLKKITMDVLPEFNEVAERHKSSYNTVKGYLEFHEVTEAPVQGGNFFAGSGTCSGAPVITGNATDGYEITLTFATPIVEPSLGTYGCVFFTQYDGYGTKINDCKNIYLDDITTYYASGMALNIDNTENAYVNRFNIMRKEGSKTMVTSTADGMHMSMMSGIVKITNSLVEYTGDDALNIKHGYYYRVSDRSSSFRKQFTLQQITSSMPEPQPGDKIAVYNEETFVPHNPDAGYYTIESCENDNGNYTVTVKERLVGDAEEWGNCRATFISNTPKFEFSNNIVRNKRNRGILVQVPEPIIANNTFNHVGHGSIMVHSSMDVFNEATLPQTPTIINNKIMNGCYLANGALSGDTSLFAISKNGNIGPKGVLHGLTYSNNFVANNGSAALSLRATSDNIVTDNLFVNIGVLENLTETVKGVVSLNNSGTTLIKNNYNFNERSQNLNGVVLRGLSGTNDVTLENNFDLDFERIEGDAGPEVHVSKVTNNFTIDGSLSDWANIDAHEVVFNGYSYADNTRTTKEAVADHFAIKTFKLTYTDDGVYFGFDILDNKIEVKDKLEFWYGDCVEIFATNVIDKPTADLQVYCKESGSDTLQIALAPTWQYTLAAVRTSNTALDHKNDVQASVVNTSDGYSGELFLPFSVVPSWVDTIANGGQIDMAIVVADCKRDNEGLVRLQAGNVPHFVENYKTMTLSMPQYFFE